MHLGKLYPYHTQQDYTWNDSPFSFNLSKPPRKIKSQIYGDSAGGSLASAWIPGFILSEVGEVESHPGYICYKTSHPTIADDFVLLLWTAKDQEAGDDKRTYIEYTYEYWHGGIRYGTRRSFTGDLIFIPPSYINTADTGPPNWDNLVNTSLFKYFSYFQFAAAKWSDQPEYQPYRTRPS